MKNLHYFEEFFIILKKAFIIFFRQAGRANQTSPGALRHPLSHNHLTLTNHTSFQVRRTTLNAGFVCFQTASISSPGCKIRQRLSVLASSAALNACTSCLITGKVL